MREIKFRVYCKRENNYKKHKVTKLEYKRYGEMEISNIHIGDYKIDGNALKYGFAILSQYTGLKDKNGVEIYEGDIVSGYIGNDNQEYIGICEYSLKIAGFKFGNQKTNSYSKSTVTTARLKEKTVIGNIYENKELLEGK